MWISKESYRDKGVSWSAIYFDTRYELRRINATHKREGERERENKRGILSVRDIRSRGKVDLITFVEKPRSHMVHLKGRSFV